MTTKLISSLCIFSLLLLGSTLLYAADLDTNSTSTTTLTKTCNFTGQCLPLAAKSGILQLCTSVCTLAVTKDDTQAKVCNVNTGDCIQATADKNSDEFKIVEHLCPNIPQCRVMVK